LYCNKKINPNFNGFFFQGLICADIVRYDVPAVLEAFIEITVAARCAFSTFDL